MIRIIDLSIICRSCGRVGWSLIYIKRHTVRMLPGAYTVRGKQLFQKYLKYNLARRISFGLDILQAGPNLFARTSTTY